MVNDIPKDIPDEVQRWTAKRWVALVLSILKGETSAAVVTAPLPRLLQARGLKGR